ncbi:MAG: intradiol ring-cleavage dioxygenase, partial [Chloroflexota bacterium]
MDNDDKPIGTILNRRDVLKIFGIGSAATLVASCAPEVGDNVSTISVPPTLPATQAIATLANSNAIPACVVRPEMTEGPYFVDEMLNRSDIRSDPM